MIYQNSMLVQGKRLASMGVNPFTTGNPFLGTKLLGFSIGRGSGAPKGLSLQQPHRTTTSPYEYTTVHQPYTGAPILRAEGSANVLIQEHKQTRHTMYA